MLYSSRYIASVFELTERRVRQLRDEGVLTEQRKGYFELLPTIQSYIKYLRNQISDPNQTSDYNTERARLIKAKRERQELELDLQRGDAHSTEIVEQIVSDMLIRFKNRMLSIPGKCSPELCKTDQLNDINELLTTVIKEALDELSDFTTSLKQYGEDVGAESNEE